MKEIILAPAITEKINLTDYVYRSNNILVGKKGKCHKFLVKINYKQYQWRFVYLNDNKSPNSYVDYISVVEAIEDILNNKFQVYSLRNKTELYELLGETYAK